MLTGYKWSEDNFDGIFEVKSEKNGEKDILKKQHVEKTFNSVLVDPKEINEAEDAIKNINITGLNINKVESEISSDTGNLIFKITTSLAEDYLWDDNNFNGYFEIETSWKAKVENKTYYIDDNGKEVSIDGPAPDGTEKITQIGYDQNFKAYSIKNS
ncbi:hypothetical protein [Mesoplasma florum]|uniref:hypothetical protein n=1 Tax=Mesoplasma florum TaxID=2151 RepID=UPI000BE30AF6|nr:hypothetical protein [Mesoplasma florum]ATI74137.1 hypothetical protein CQZ70_02680 [Mesoplasma florum]